MFQPSAGPDTNDLYAMLAAVNRKLVELQKEVVYLNGVVWEEHKRVEEVIQRQPPSPLARKPR